MSAPIILTFAEAKQPVFSVARGGHIVKFGDDNLYPEYMQMLYDKATKHGSLIDGKKDYIVGKGWRVKGGAADPGFDNWQQRVNRYGETLNEVSDKVALDVEIFEGAYLQVIWNNAGTGIAEIYHLEYLKMRTNDDNTQFIYRPGSWRNNYTTRQKDDKMYPAFNPANPRGSQVLFLRVYRPGMGAYPLPKYMRGVDYVNAEIEVGKHTNSNASSGFTPSKSITMVNGEPENDDEKKSITKRFEKAYTGAGGKKFILWFTNGADQAPVITDLGASDLTKEDYTAIDNLIRDNIYHAHRITTPALFGVATPGSLGQRTELETGYEIFNNTYVLPRQTFLAAGFNRIAKYCGVSAQIEIIPADPLSIQFSEATIKDVAPKAWILEKLGIDAAKYPETAQAEQQLDAASGTNSAIRKMSGRELQGYERIMRKLRSGALTEAEARTFLKSGLGLSDEEIDTILAADNQPQPAQLGEANDTDTVVALFQELGEAKDLFTIHHSIAVRKGTEDTEAIMLDPKGMQLQFVASPPNLSKLQADILDLISKDKRIDAETIARTLKSKLNDVQRELDDLLKLKIIRTSTEGDTVTRELTRPLSELLENLEPATREFVVKYSYEGPKDDRNRPFCAKMLSLNRLYSRTEIETISLRLGYSVWDRRGGFRYDPKAKETLPYCRHTWMSHLVEKKQA